MRRSREDGGKKSRRQGRFLRESRRKEIKAPAAAFIEGARHSHISRTEDRWGKEQPSPAPWSGENLEAPTSPDFDAYCTRALISQVKRRIRPGHNGTVIPTSHASRLKRGALKSYVRAVPSRTSGARPPADPEQCRRAVSVGRRLHLARPPIDPEQDCKVVSVGRRLRLARPPIDPE